MGTVELYWGHQSKVWESLFLHGPAVAEKDSPPPLGSLSTPQSPRRGGGGSSLPCVFEFPSAEDEVKCQSLSQPHGARRCLGGFLSAPVVAVVNVSAASCPQGVEQITPAPLQEQFFNVTSAVLAAAVRHHDNNINTPGTAGASDRI